MKITAFLAHTTVLLFAVTVFAEETPTCQDLLRLKEEAVTILTTENSSLKEKCLKPPTPSISSKDLQTRMMARLKEISGDMKQQRHAMWDFQGYVTWMSGSISGYSKYIEAGSVAAGFARILPIPYAGQAGMFTKFISHFTLSLSSASKSITSFMATSQQFTERVEALEKNPAPEKEMAELSKLADDQLLKDMNDLKAKLSTTSELSASAMSFLESLNSYVGSTDEYWTKAKNLVKKDADKKEKSYLAESINSLKNKAELFNGRLRGFDDTVKKDIPLIKTLGAYNELLAYLTWLQAESMDSGVKPQPQHLTANDSNLNCNQTWPTL